MTEINEKIVADTPYSVALDGIERRLRALKNRVRLTVPLHSLGLPAPLALEAEVDVEFVSVRGGKGLTQLHDEMTIHWEPTLPGPYPHFDGKFHMPPLGTKTELLLSGAYQPPLGVFGAAFDAVIGS